MINSGIEVGDVVSSEQGWRGVAVDMTVDGERVGVNYEWTGDIRWVSADSLTVAINRRSRAVGRHFALINVRRNDGSMYSLRVEGQGKEFSDTLRNWADAVDETESK